MHVTANSKEVLPGSIFFALKGAKYDGHQFINQALALGAGKIYTEYETGHPEAEVLGKGARKKLAELASEMADHPTHGLKMIGVTGTSGKTTTTYLIHHLLSHNAIPCARMGTNGGFFKNKEVQTSNTTPDPVTLQNWFGQVKRLGAQAVVMEVSSHALDQDRAWAIAWDAACFLNLSREHMDYHPTLEHYLETKSRLFLEHADYSKTLNKNPALFVNRDSPYGLVLAKKSKDIQTFSAYDQIRNLKNTPTGISFEVNLDGTFLPATCPLFGSFQTENILAALSVGLALGISPKHLLEVLATFPGVPGRMESIANERGVFVFVDYAHKPEALEKVLQSLALNEEERSQGRHILTVFGCGGDRDKTKRPVMGEIATRLSDFVYVTSDNPRTEDPLQILKEVESGISLKNYQVIPDRAEAIRLAITNAKAGDIVLIAGKGHEDYQIIGTAKLHFDDREQARLALKR
ncbi:MAG: UDP-N-acetylmuramoyl-L-alanyl-D-glutamate--2,6-diaminopimelate ligase [Bdellovibrionales bacterium]|nr:UDP-N-acetylmuramoyl-L-alanyl-D-glutamate--2,6-diaminopimelate ligase [Oligoflexia bacterium]